jgi:hypothetical protein
MLTEVAQGSKIRQQAATSVYMCLMFRCNGRWYGLTRCEPGLLSRQLACEGSLEVFQLGERTRVPALDAQREFLLLRT